MKNKRVILYIIFKKHSINENKKDFKKVNLYLFLRIFFIIRFKNSKLTLDLSNKNSNIKCEYAIISIMIHLYRGRIKHIKLLSKRREAHCIKTK